MSGTIFCLGSLYDMNIVANTCNSLTIFADIDRGISIEEWVRRQCYRFSRDVPYLSISKPQIRVVHPDRMFPHFRSESVQQGFAIEIQCYNMWHISWCLIGDPLSMYQDLYSRFFSVPKCLVRNDLPTIGTKATSPQDLWKMFESRANNNDQWVRPMRIQRSSYFTI